MPQWLLSTFTFILAFVCGLAAPALSAAAGELITGWIGKSRRREELTETRSRQAAEACYEELAALRDLIPQLAADRRTSRSARATDDDRARTETTTAVHAAALARLEANIVLLAEPARNEMRRTLSVLRYAYDLPYERSPRSAFELGWHPDSAANIAQGLVQHAREVLASSLRGGPVPERSDSVVEYFIANEDRNGDLSAEFAQEIDEEEAAIRVWREQHGLAPHRHHQ